MLKVCPISECDLVADSIFASFDFSRRETAFGDLRVSWENCAIGVTHMRS